MRYFLFVFLFVSVFAEEETQGMYFGNLPVPWFTGPLLAPSARVVAAGHMKLQIYWDTFANIADDDSDWKAKSIENFYTEELRTQIKIGLFDRVDFQVAPRIVYHFTEHARAFNVGDLPFAFGLQILRQRTIHNGPNLKLSLIGNAPTGKYQHLNAHKKKTDASGSGCWFPGIGLFLSQLWYFSGPHYLDVRWTASYRFGVPVHVRGFNTYGGDNTTKGTVYPGNYWTLDSALQYSLTRNWVAACDFRYRHLNRTRFSGHGLKSTRHSGEEWSLAPAIEYNFSRDLGIIGGVWFSIAGRNVPQFVNGILSLVSYY